jgi:hypothetical protein
MWKNIGWNCFLHAGSIEDEGDNYDVSILTGLMRLLFPDSDIKAEMVSPPWNNFLESLLRFIVVRSGHNKGLGRISFTSVFLIFRWQIEEGRHQKEKVSQLRLHKCWPSFVGHLSQAFCRVFACAVIHTAKRRTCLVLRSELLTAWVQFRWKSVSGYLCNP